MSKASPLSEVPSQYILPYKPEPDVSISYLEGLAIRIRDIFSKLANWMHSFKEHMIAQCGLKKEVRIPTPSELMPLDANEKILPPCQPIWEPETRSAKLDFMPAPILYHAELVGNIAASIEVIPEAPSSQVAVKLPAVDKLPDIQIIETKAEKLADKAEFFKKKGPQAATVIPAPKVQSARILSEKQIKEARQLAKAKSFGVKIERLFKRYFQIR